MTAKWHCLSGSLGSISILQTLSRATCHLMINEIIWRYAYFFIYKELSVGISVGLFH